MARVYSVDPILFHRFSGVDVENFFLGSATMKYSP
jgi:hypothetical protein